MPERLVEIPEGYLRADMHCHTYHSGLTGHMTAFEPMDSYNSPEGLYKLAKQRGMDLVTITDHDSIDGCLAFLNRHPDASDFFIGEEVTVNIPEFRCSVHIAVYGINESQHREIQRLRSNFDDTISYLKQNGIIYALNHLFHGFPRPEHGKQFMEKMIASFDLFEGLNGAIDEGPNNIMLQLSEYFPGKSLIAGSDSHTLLRLGKCFTACKAASKEEFLNELRAGETIIAGRYGHFHHVFNDAMGVYLNYFRDLVFTRQVHVHWPLWKEIRNALGWIVCLPVFFAGALGGLAVSRLLEKSRQKEFENYIDDLSRSATGGDLCLQLR